MKNIFRNTLLGVTAVAFMTTMVACDNLENEEASKSNKVEAKESSTEE